MTWGNIAVGCRIGKCPESLFFASWTGLIVGGLRENDVVLAPSANMPAHWASDALARAFLRTECDTLLMIDDDMAFDALDLERLRTHEASFDYDIVFAFCTTRTLPPKPVMMRRADEQPGVYGGENFYTVSSFTDGEVVPVDTVGLAFTLIKRHVFEAMTAKTAGQNYFFTYGYGRETDDIPFCRRARELGFRMGVDTAVKIDHIGHIPIGWQFLRVKNNG